MTPAQFKHDRAAEAVANHNRLLQSQLGTLPGDIVREPRHGVFLLRRVAGAVAAKIDGHHATGLPEMGDLDVFGILPPIKREALTMKVEWPAFTVERWPNHSPDQLRLQQAPPRGNLGYSITSSARDPGDPRCSALAANRPFAMDIRGVPHHGRQTDV